MVAVGAFGPAVAAAVACCTFAVAAAGSAYTFAVVGQKMVAVAAVVAEAVAAYPYWEHPSSVQHILQSESFAAEKPKVKTKSTSTVYKNFAGPFTKRRVVQSC